MKRVIQAGECYHLVAREARMAFPLAVRPTFTQRAGHPGMNAGLTYTVKHIQKGPPLLITGGDEMEEFRG